MWKSKLLIFMFVAFNFLIADSTTKRSGQANNNGRGKVKTALLGIFKQTKLRDDQSSSNCSKKNPFLTHLYQRGVDLYEDPQFHAAGCPSEWKAHGTCCNEQQLREYASKDQADITRAADLLMEHFLQFVQTMKPLYTLLSEMESNKEDRRRDNDLATKLLKSFDQNNLKYFASLMDLINSPEEMLKHKTETKTCWAKVTDMRKRALCETCSGRSEIFFEKNLAKISQKNCNDLMLACAKSFSFTVRFLKILGILLRDIQDSSLIEKNDWNAKSQLRRFGSISQEISSGHLACKISHLQKKTKDSAHFPNDSKKGDTKPPVPNEHGQEFDVESSDLCDKFLRLSKEPFILTIADYFNIDMDIFTRAFEDIRGNQQYSSFGRAGPSNWRLGKRLLGMGGQTQSSSTGVNYFFSGDTKTCQTATCQSMDMQEYP